jgi:hypothetical protein
MNRSLVKLTKADLASLGRIAAVDRSDLFARRPDTGRLYARRLFAVALCQGAALHYLDGRNGIKDLDVWCFYTESPYRPFPYRRRGKRDFGHSKFGTTPGSPDFIGRRVDVIGRSIRGAKPSDQVGSLRRYLQAGATKSARLLAQKAVILIEPAPLLGTVVWPP